MNGRTVWQYVRLREGHRTEDNKADKEKSKIRQPDQESDKGDRQPRERERESLQKKR